MKLTHACNIIYGHMRVCRLVTFSGHVLDRENESFPFTVFFFSRV